jgi:putative glutathione S-transferase
MQDALSGLDFLYQLYLKADPSYEGRVTVPVLWDKQTQTIVSSESSEIVRMFNTASNSLTGNVKDYYSKHLHLQIDSLNDRIYDTINNGVYKAGFATTQQAYEEAFHNLLQSLDWVENLLLQQR